MPFFLQDYTRAFKRLKYLQLTHESKSCGILYTVRPKVNSKKRLQQAILTIPIDCYTIKNSPPQVGVDSTGIM